MGFLFETTGESRHRPEQSESDLRDRRVHRSMHAASSGRGNSLKASTSA